MSVVESALERPTPAYRLSSPLRFDLEGQAFKRDPFPVLAAMRAAGPVIPVRLPLLGKAWMTTTHAATLAMVKDNGLFVQEGRHAGRSGVTGMQWWMPRSLKLLANNMLMKDEPDHRRLRTLVDKAFARRDVLAMRGDIAAIADRLLDGFGGRDEVDLAEAYSRRLPLEVICDLLGLPEKDRGDFARRSQAALAVKGAIGLFQAAASFEKLTDYLRGQIEEVRRTPRRGLIGELVLAEEAGDKLDEDELVSMVFLLLVAGFETTTHLISASVVELEQHPDQKAWLLTNPAARMERAVEELARHASPVQGTKARYVSRDVDFFGQRLGRGELIMAFTASANADPEVFDQPEALRLDRFPNPHLVFSSGIHFCLGMQLARVEAQSALARLYARFPELRIVEPDRLVWMERLGIHGPKSLPVRLGAGSAPGPEANPSPAWGFRAGAQSLGADPGAPG
ncbi:MAG TPA: cytochrome P450 [Caulobacteraceae bacterium]|jgi:cytochrome P450|nr:cytochrome P450 [Caulobacteraceae bacterium]